MRHVQPGEHEHVMQVLERSRERLGALAGVRYLDVGYKLVGGQATDELAIRLHVERKIPPAELAAADVAPEEIEGIPLDVLQAGTCGSSTSTCR